MYICTRMREAAAAAVAQMTDVKERGEKEKVADHRANSTQRADYYCVLFFCLCGRRRFAELFFSLTLSLTHIGVRIQRGKKRERETDRSSCCFPAQTATYGQKVISKI